MFARNGDGYFVVDAHCHFRNASPEYWVKRQAQYAKGCKLEGAKRYTAEWYNGSRGWGLDDEMCKPFYAKCKELGIKNIHVHKGPTIWPLDKDAFDPGDVDEAATDNPELNFIV